MAIPTYVSVCALGEGYFSQPECDVSVLAGIDCPHCSTITRLDFSAKSSKKERRRGRRGRREGRKEGEREKEKKASLAW